MYLKWSTLRKLIYPSCLKIIRLYYGLWKLKTKIQVYPLLDHISEKERVEKNIIETSQSIFMYYIWIRKIPNIFWDTHTLQWVLENLTRTCTWQRQRCQRESIWLWLLLTSLHHWSVEISALHTSDTDLCAMSDNQATAVFGWYVCINIIL